jgi:hypothetical protein
MLYVSLIASAVLLATSLYAVANTHDLRRTYLKVWRGLLVGVIPCLCLFLPAYLLQAVLTGGVAMVCRWTGAGLKGFALGSVAAFIAGYAIIGFPRAAEYGEAIRQNPFESLADRMAYEVPRSTAQEKSVARSPFNADDENDLDRRLSESQGNRRSWVLKQLHEDCIRLFASDPGFGVIRMIGPGLRDITQGDTIRNSEPVPLPESPQSGEGPSLSSGDNSLELAAGSTINGPPTIGGRDLRTFHDGSVDEFANPLGFGYVRDREHVAGFISHRFTKFPYKPMLPKEGGHWRIESLDLISLLKHPEPVAYVSKNLPRMYELRDAATRPLDEFEAENLPKLRAGSEMADAQAPRRVRVVGALRARADCIKCHNVDQGELLGAFSYDLRRDLPNPR